MTTPETGPAALANKLKQTVVVLKDNEPIETAVHAMIDKGISCVLIEDRKQKICGIVTERDIVRRLTLSDRAGKLDSMVRAIMTYPVMCIPPTEIKKNLRPLLFHQRLRHFPIATTSEPKTDELIGIITVTDLARLYIKAEDKVEQPIEVALVATGGGYHMQLRQILTDLGYSIMAFKDWQAHPGREGAVVVDLDDPLAKDKELLNRILGYRHHVMFLTSKSERYAPIRTRLKNPKHHVLLKPVDFTVLGLLLADAARQCRKTAPKTKAAS